MVFFNTFDKQTTIFFILFTLFSSSAKPWSENGMETKNIILLGYRFND